MTKPRHDSSLAARATRFTLASVFCLTLNSCFTLMTVDCVDRNVSAGNKDLALNALMPLAVTGDIVTAPAQLIMLGILTECGTQPLYW